MIGTKKQILEYLQDKDEQTLFEYKEYKQKRTISQNRLYHGYFLKKLCFLLNDKGIVTTSEDLHEELKTRFLNKRVKSPITKRYNKITFSTTGLNTKEFKQYIERVNNWMIDRIGEGVDLNVSQADLIYRENLFL